MNPYKIIIINLKETINILVVNKVTYIKQYLKQRFQQWETTMTLQALFPRNRCAIRVTRENVSEIIYNVYCQ